MLLAQSISKTFSRKSKVLTDVSLAVKPGSITAIVGPSGGGKSTFAKAISLLDPPSSGVVEIDGVSHAFPASRLKSRVSSYSSHWPDVSLVFQQLFLWPHLTLENNILLPRKKRAGLPEEEVSRLITYFDLRDVITRYPNETSLGQRQRAALIRALALCPKYLILDEVTSALDMEQVQKLQRHLLECRAQGMGILLITHLIGFAFRTADSVAFLDQGRVSEATPADWLTHPKDDRAREFFSTAGTTNLSGAVIG